MEVIDYQYKPYGYTLRRTTDPKNADKEKYIKHLGRIFPPMGCRLCETVFEHEGGLHAHGVVDIPKKADMKRFRFRGWHLKLEELYDPQQWYIYLNKSQPNPLIDMIDPPDDSPLPKKRIIPLSPPNQ